MIRETLRSIRRGLRRSRRPGSDMPTVARNDFFAPLEQRVLLSSQVITATPSVVETTAEQPVAIVVEYSTADPVDETLTGLGLRFHFDSSQLTFEDVTGLLGTNLFAPANAESITIESDTADFDGNPDTDSYFNIAWLDFAGNWPGNGTTPATLYTVNFTTSAEFAGTAIGFSASSTAAGRVLDAPPVTIDLFVPPPPATIGGTKYHDLNGNGTRQGGEPGLEGWEIYIDANNSGTLDDGEVSVLTDENGEYSFGDLEPGTYRIREVLQGGWRQTGPASGVHTVTVVSGDNVTRNFANQQLGVIAGSVFSDLNSDGVLDAGEPGAAGWTIYIDANNNGALDEGEVSDSTDGDGSFAFDNIIPGDHVVRLVSQAGFDLTAPEAGFFTASVAPGETVDDLLFGVAVQPGSISVLKFADNNINGVQDDGEAGVADWTVYIDANENGVLDDGELTGVTNADGVYTFEGLAPGTYVVREVEQDGWRHTSPESEFHEVIVVAGGAYEVAFGNVQLGSLSGTKYHDLNANGTRQSGEGEVGLEGWTIYIDANNNGELDDDELSTLTDETGAYSFGDLDPGTYRLREVLQDGWRQTSPISGAHVVTLAAGQNATRNFGNQALGTINGSVFADEDQNGTQDGGEQGLSGWTVFVDANGNGTLDDGEASAVTGAGGGFSIANVIPGDQTVAIVVQAGFELTTPAGGAFDVTVAPGGTVDDLLFGVFVQPGSISGVKYHDVNADGTRNGGEAGLAGWTLFIDGNDNGILDAGEVSVVTDADGSFTFTGLVPGDYVVQEVQQAGWRAINPENGIAAVTVTAGENTAVSFGNQQLGVISGVKYHDLDADGTRGDGEAGLGGWTIYLDANNNGAFDDGEVAVVTDEFGAFWFADLTPGEHVVREVLQAGWRQISPDGESATVTVVGGGNAELNFGNRQLGVISGVKYHDVDADGTRGGDEPGVEGWTIFLDYNNDGVLDAANEPSVVTDATGAFEFIDLDPGDYVVREVAQDGWRVIAPASGATTAAVVAGEETVVSFGNQQLGVISGTAFQDGNANGVRDAGEPGLVNWTVFLDENGNGAVDAGEVSVQTGADGAFTFDNLVPGDYDLRLLVPEGFDPLVVQLAVSVAGGETADGQLLSAKPSIVPGSISGFKYNDQNRNGQRDAGEPGLEGWTIYIDQNANGVLDAGEVSVVTGADGSFVFENLLPDTYILREVLQAGFEQTSPNGGFHSITVAEAQDVTDVTFGNRSLSDPLLLHTLTNRTQQIVDPDGTRVNVSYFGPGAALIFDNGRGGIDILVSDSTLASALTISPISGGNGIANIDTIGTNSSIGQIVAPLADIAGDIAVDGTTRLIQARDLVGLGDRLVGVGGSASDFTTLLFRNLTDVTVFSDSTVNVFQALGNVHGSDLVIDGRANVVVMLGEVSDSTIAIDGALNSLRLGRVQSLDLIVNGQVNAIYTLGWAEGWLGAQSVNSLVSVGNFGADVDLSGVGAPPLAPAISNVLDGTSNTFFFGDGSVRFVQPGFGQSPITPPRPVAPRFTLNAATIVGNVTGDWSVDGNVNVINITGRADEFHLDVAGRLNQLIFGDAGEVLVHVDGVIGTIYTRGGWDAGEITGRQLNVLVSVGDFAADLTLFGPVTGSPFALNVAHIIGRLGGGIDDPALWQINGATNVVIATSVNGLAMLTGNQTLGMNTLVVHREARHFDLFSMSTINTIVMGRMVDVRIGAGVVEEPADPMTAADFVNKAALIGTLIVTGAGVPANQPTFVDSAIAAWRIGYASLQRVQVANDGESLGIAANRVQTLVRIVGGQTVVLSNLEPGDDVVDGDFRVRLVPA